MNARYRDIFCDFNKGMNKRDISKKYGLHWASIDRIIRIETEHENMMNNEVYSYMCDISYSKNVFTRAWKGLQEYFGSKNVSEEDIRTLDHNSLKKFPGIGAQSLSVINKVVRHFKKEH